MINLIVAHTINKVIGKNGDLVWKNKLDMQRFKTLTQNAIVVMGKNTQLSLPKKLPNRINCVLSTTLKSNEDIEVFDNIDNFIKKYNDNVQVIGGSYIYNEFLNRNLVDNIYLTLIDEIIEGDTYFPEIDLNMWSVLDVENHNGFKFIKMCKKL